MYIKARQGEILLVCEKPQLEDPSKTKGFSCQSQLLMADKKDIPPHPQAHSIKKKF